MLAEGVPESSPVVVLKEAHAGLWAIANANVRRSLSLAVGVKAYGCPAVTLGAGAPEIVTWSRQRRHSLLVPSEAALTVHHAIPTTSAIKVRGARCVPK